MSFKIVIDITCDLAPEIRERYGIEYIKGHLTAPDGTEIISAMEWGDESCEEFYAKLKKNPDGYKTAPPTLPEVTAVFEEHAKKGEDVLYFCMSSKMSCTYDIACNARDDLKAKYPDVKIFVVDSRKFATGAGLLAVLAAEKREEGIGIEETAAYCEEIKWCIHQAGWHDDLQFSAKKGRISNSKAFMGTLIGIKPCGDFSKDGMTTVLTKIKGEKSAFKILLDYIGETVVEPEKQVMIVASSARRPQAEKFLAMIKERFSPKEIYYTDIYRSSGTNAGPGIMACYYTGKPISEDLKEEGEIFARLGG